MQKPLARRSSHVAYAIRDIVQKAQELERRGKKLYRFNIGDPNIFDFRPPKHITEAIVEAARDGRYTAYAPSDGDPQLRGVISKIEGVPPTDVFVTSGLSEGIDFLFFSLLDEGEDILLPMPSYPLYNTKSKIYGGRGNFYRCDENWEPDVEDLRRKVGKRTKAIVVINPNNPTGANYSRKTLQGIADVAAEHKLPIIADEIYDKLVLDGKSVNMRDVVRDDTVLISGNGVSKNFLYPGARVGYVAIHNEGSGVLSDAVRKLCNARLSVNWEMQRGAIAAFSGPLGHLDEAKRKLRERRDIIYKRLNEIEGISCAKPLAAFYAFPKIEGGKWKSDTEFVYSLLEKTGIVSVPGSGFSDGLDGKYFRLVYLPQPPVLNEALDLLEKFMAANR